VKRDYIAIAEEYQQGVLSGQIPAGQWVIAACQRQRDDLAKQGTSGFPFRWDADRATKPCRFIELLPHIKGPLARTTITLAPWQVFILTTIFGWLTEEGYRRYRRTYIEVPRGNGKSALSSGVGLYMLCADNEGGAEVYALATTRDQAKIVFGDAQNMARLTPGLKRHFGIEVGAHNINQMSTASKFEALSSESSTLDGLNIHLGIIDELHAHKTRNVYDVVETGMGKRKQSMLWVITTAGTNRAGICYEVRGFVLKILQGKAIDESQFGIIYGLDKDDDWATEEALVKANPNWGVSVMPDVILPLQAKAMSMQSAINNFKTKHLDEWCNADNPWMDMRAWDAVADPSLRREDFASCEAVVALDLASVSDIAAKVIVYRKLVRNTEHFYVFCDSYLPSETVEKEQNSQYDGWAREGHIKVTEGAICDFDVIEADLLSDTQSNFVVEVAYDPYQANQLAGRMLKQGIMMVEVRPTVLNFSEPMKQALALVTEGRLHHDGNPCFDWQISNVVCHVDAKDNIYPRKEHAENKIDGPVAMIMALSRFIARSRMPSAGMAFLD
jgi:phage terminase large subunit-like protein